MEELNVHMAREEDELPFLAEKDTENMSKPPEEAIECDDGLIGEVEAERNFNFGRSTGLPHSTTVAPTLDDLLDEQNLTVCIFIMF